MTMNMEIGMITPPVGLNLFVTSGVAQLPVTRVVHAAAPWLLVLLAMLVVVTYVPWVSLAVPSWLGL
jgi:C4-dicarboxylate transporter DctM subunit